MRKARYTYTVNIELSVRRWFFFWSPVEYVEARVSDVANEEEALGVGRQTYQPLIKTYGEEN